MRVTCAVKVAPATPIAKASIARRSASVQRVGDTLVVSAVGVRARRGETVVVVLRPRAGRSVRISVRLG